MPNGDNENEEISILPFLLADLGTLYERFFALTDSYRLFVGAAEELTRTPSANEKIIEDSIERTAFLGKILDQFLIYIQISLFLQCNNGSSNNQDNMNNDCSGPNPFL